MATTINSYNVKLSLDASDYIRKSDLSKKETAQLTRAINAARNPVDNYERQLRLADKALAKAAISQGTYNRLVGDAKAKMDRYTASLKANNSGLVSMVGHVKNLVLAYAGFATIQKSVNLAIQVEQASVQFEVMTNSAQNAKVLMRDLRDFAAKSPVTFTGATDAAKTMLMFNVQVQDVMRNVKMLGDITGGNQERFQSLTLAFSQMTSAGRLMGQDLLQMVNAGFNPLQQISEKTGESMIQLKKRMEDGGISAAEVTQAFVDATSEGGKFDGMSERLADTIGGKLTLAMSDLEQMGIKLGESLGPLIITMTEGFSKGVGPLSAMLGIVEKIADGWGFIAAIVTDVSTLVYDIAAAMAGGEGSGRTDAAESVNKFLDMMDKRDAERAAAGQDIGGLENIKPASEAVEELADNSAELKKQAKEAADALKAQERAAEALKKADSNRRQSALKNAQAHFAAERQMAMNRLKQLESTSITSMDVGSSEAAKFLADQQNARLANSSRPDPIKETQQQLLTEAQRQYEILVEQEKKQGEQNALLEQILDNAKQNGFQRIR